MKKHFAVLSLAVAGLVAGPFSLRAEDAVPPKPPKPPGGDTAPAAATPPSTAATPNPGGGAGGRMTPAERLKKMTEEFGLTQEQQDKVKAIFEKYTPQYRELFAKGRENLTDDDKAKFQELRKNQFEDIAAVLTPEQKEKFKAAMDKARAAAKPSQ